VEVVGWCFCGGVMQQLLLGWWWFMDGLGRGVARCCRTPTQGRLLACILRRGIPGRASQRAPCGGGARQGAGGWNL
jgi:hypothetical protein